MPKSPPQPTLHIGEVAERVGLSLRTVRYYEEQGLFAPAGRTDGGFRLYTDEQVHRLLLIKQMKPLGFTVAQMCELLAARDELEAPDPAVRETARARIDAFAADAAARCEHLRDQLNRAEEFARQLATHALPQRTPT
ncbi:MerR family transcriptional regulator [Paraconexibacter antarcticus]|uniref:MerR family transcriptional regulator n=1 Tax=Paraconexibacter antarcticus TaxID=2949664 RepID=A0ABY5DNZ9_9ACTN|nr:MerR family transcriptional regulator [Paraconexibacter antarcticus]UTI63386.1 MerR family transcriptional regulator [Paraconexibacter antarcticus]